MTGRFPNDPDPGSSWVQITQAGVAFPDHARIVGYSETDPPPSFCQVRPSEDVRYVTASRTLAQARVPVLRSQAEICE